MPDERNLPARGDSVRLAYLCNVYPAVSHSFVRREVEGLEAAGHDVRRFSMRQSGDDLKDEADVREARITEVALGHGIATLALSALILCLTRPAKTLAAINAARRLSGPGLKRKARHVAYWLEAAWLVRRLQHHRIEHLHAHFGTNPAAVAAIAQAWGGPPFSFTAHGPDEFDAPVELRLAEKVRRAAFVAAISSFGRAQLMRWSDPAQWDKIKIVRCGLDQSFLSAQETPVSESCTNFVTVARLSAQKGLPLLIEACDQLHRAGEKFSMTIIGDGELRAEIERELSDRGLQGIVTLTGSRSAAEIREHLRQCRAFVLPSFAEGLPVVLMEALALSRPVITTSVAGIPELVDNECGWPIPAGSVTAITEAMHAALSCSTSDLAAKGAVGRARVMEMHDAARNAQLIAKAVTESTSIPVT
jgi:glycosyltransferase involved in cell wall biosynthesis